METNSKNSSNQPSPNHEHHSFMAWGALLGSGLGLVIGAFTQHWLAWAVMIGASCLIIGALIDRNRR